MNDLERYCYEDILLTYKAYKGMRRRKHLKLLFDFVITIVTGGLWLIWILVRYFRSKGETNGR